MKLANKAGIWLLELNIDENWGILRCSHITKEQIITVLSLIKKIRDFPLIISPVKTSGILNKLKKTKNHLCN